MKKYYLIILLLGNLLTGKLLFAQNLGYNQGDYLEIGSRAGFTNNDFKNKLWLYRWVNGSGWTSAALFDGISIDVSCLIPGVDARTWWKRDPAGEIQSWGTRNETYMTLNGPRLGLGTTDPKTLLDVQSNQNGWMMSSRVNAVSAGEINGLKFYSGYIGDDKWAGIASIAESLHSNKTGLALFSGMSERVRISGDGNVGIGTSLPESKLRVVGGGVVIGRYATANDTDGNLSIGDISMNSSPNPGTWTYGTNMLISGLDFTTIGFHDAGERVDFIRSGKGTIELGYDGGWGHANIGFPNGIWNAAGNLGIGTAAPTERLTVNGKIKANEIRVDGAGAPDYVFEEDYKVATLAELESYIKANKHLPEVPSAKEFERDGMALGEMNKLLLKKIEELTLHLIEKDKVLSDVQERLLKLEKNKK